MFAVPTTTGSLCHPDREIGVRIETLRSSSLNPSALGHPDREIGVRIETNLGGHVSQELRVTPIVRSGCGLKPTVHCGPVAHLESPRS